MITHIHSATLMVADQDAALDFYVGKLGWEKRADSVYGEAGARWVEVGPKDADTVIALIRPQDADAPPEASGSYKGLSLVADDIDSTYKDLSEKGVEFTQPPEEMPWGQKATWFDDPDGNRFFLVEG